MLGRMTQPVEMPTADDLLRVEKHRDWTRGHFEPDQQDLYAAYDQKLILLATILANKWIEPSETWKLQSLGITLGDALVERHGFEWVTVEDEYGRDPALRLVGTSILVFPLTMISKRIENGETVDIYAMIAGVQRTVANIVAQLQSST